MDLEVGGKTKKEEQIKKVKNAFLALDEIDSAYQKRIPLWFFGVLY